MEEGAKMIEKYGYDKWEPEIRSYGLSGRVLAVASTRIEGKWTAYIDAVPGNDHFEEIDGVLRNGNKLPEAVARILFPDFWELPYSE